MLDRALSGLSQIVDGPLGQPTLDEMVRQELGLGFDSLREAFLESLSDTAMKLLLPVANQGAVCCVSNERVLEDIGRIRRLAPNVYQLESRKLGESRL
jgi:hypothetical protein